jgi:hypothetical protein
MLSTNCSRYYKPALSYVKSSIEIQTLLNLTFMGPCIVRIFQYISKVIPIHIQEYSNLYPRIFQYNYIQQDAALHSLFYMETALNIWGVTSTHHQERKQLYLQHLVFVTPLMLPAAIEASSSNGVTNTRCCRYSCLRS